MNIIYRSKLCYFFIVFLLVNVKFTICEEYTMQYLSGEKYVITTHVFDENKTVANYFGRMDDRKHAPFLSINKTRTIYSLQENSTFIKSGELEKNQLFEIIAKKYNPVITTGMYLIHITNSSNLWDGWIEVENDSYDSIFNHMNLPYSPHSFCISGDNKQIAYINDDGQIVVKNNHNEILTVTKNFIFDEDHGLYAWNASFIGWSDDNSTLWLITTEDIDYRFIVDINVASQSYHMYPFPKRFGNWYSEWLIDLNKKILYFSDYPCEYCDDHENEYIKQGRLFNLYKTNLGSLEIIAIDSNKGYQFRPRLSSTGNIEYFSSKTHIYIPVK